MFARARNKTRQAAALIRHIFEAIFLFVKELNSAMRFKIFPDNDKDFLAINIRKRAHHIEKILLLRDGYDNHSEWSVLFSQLEDFLKQWSDLYNEENEEIKWARRILSEFSVFEKRSGDCALRNTPVNFKPDNLAEGLLRRRSYRLFTGAKIEEDTLRQLIKLAQAAPSSCNRQALVYLIIKEEPIKVVVAGSIPGARQFAAKAPVIIVVLADKRDYRFPEERFTPFQDAAAAVQNILLASESFGMGACWCSYTSYSSVKNEKKIRALLNIGSKYLICAAVMLGFPAQEVCALPRRNSEEVIYWDRLK